MSWWSTVPLLAAAAAIFFVPGAVIAWASRVRGFALVALAPALTVTSASVAAMAVPYLGLQWSVFVVLGFSLVLAAVAFLLSHGTARRWPGPRRRGYGWVVPLAEMIAVALGALLVGRRLVYAFGTPGAISQTFDNVFHLNAIRYIVDTGSASSLSITTLTGGGFYPAAWHDMVSLLIDVTGTQIPVAVNLINICIGALVWPVGCIYLVQQIVGRRALPSIIAGVLSAAFGSFPLLMLDFGVLYPNVLAISLLPIALGASLQALGVARERTASPVVSWLLLLAVLPGMTLAHPSSTMALVALLVPVLLGIWWREVRPRLGRWRATWKQLALYVVAVLVSAAVLRVVWQSVRPPESASTWTPVETTANAIGELIASAPLGRPVSWLVLILAAVGITTLLARRQHQWLVGMYGVLGALFVIVASFPVGPLRTFYTGVWYNDPPRLAALLPVATLPLAVVGAMTVLEWAYGRWGEQLLTTFHNSRPSQQGKFDGKLVTRWGGVAALAVLTVALMAGTQQTNVRVAAKHAAASYQLSAESPLLSVDEKKLLERLDEEVPVGEVLAGNPWNGSALAYSIADRRTIQIGILGKLPVGATEIYDRLNDAKTDPDVCPAVRSLGIHYVLDFGHQEVHGQDHGFQGLDNLGTRGVATLIDHEGQAKLYKLTTCW
ncbi:DUF6541 family protein [Arthrobacter sp. H14-L1]|uniref:DUF6541 family protein n=1 Tax=Arthrobacter sp. H14-L1 TaxID=2996697 RepID=UPI00226E4CD3|nr:DUF6541 family protein [Arthrobacter sp. H14-L1]MCY0903570.1 hypothetical protein [Arthrobacter sp. H14-L1]